MKALTLMLREDFTPHRELLRRTLAGPTKLTPIKQGYRFERDAELLCARLKGPSGRIGTLPTRVVRRKTRTVMSSERTCQHHHDAWSGRARASQTSGAKWPMRNGKHPCAHRPLRSSAGSCPSSRRAQG
jgi:hypothetical protein